jgi:hypothetical protein
MKLTSVLAAATLSAALVLTPAVAKPAAAQQLFPDSVATAVPFVLWAITGAIIGAVAWPVVAGGAAAGAAPAGLVTVDALLNTGTLAGAVLGGAGFMMTR